MKRFILLLAALHFACSTEPAPRLDLATGIVYHDRNGNNIRDEDEPGISGVAVSNGTDVVLTDENGRYTLPIGNDAIVFVIKPGHYRYPVDEHNLARFYYIHKPAGSPPLSYPGVEPTGPLPESLDFPLLSGNDSDEFSILVFSDPQPYSEEEVDFYDRGIVEELVGSTGYEFGITLGDIVGDRPDLFEAVNKATARIGVPWHNVLGNHDLNFDAETQCTADESFERVYGPATYAFNQGRAHFIVLDNVIFPNDYSESRYIGGLREDQFQFIENTLSYVPEDYLVVINTHIHLFNESPEIETFRNRDRERLFELLRDRDHTLSISGHLHTQRHHFFTSADGWRRDAPHHHFNPGVASGDWWTGVRDKNGIPDATMRDGTPKGYAIIHFVGNRYTIDYKVAGKPHDYRMRIYGPKVVPRNQPFRGEFYVNFFQGSPFCRVDYRIGDGDWRPMRRTLEQDPHYSLIRHQWDRAEELPDGIRPSNPSVSHHLWKTRISTDLPPGTNTFHVRVTDMFERVFSDSFDFRVAEVR